MCKKEYPINEKSDIPFLHIRCGMTHTSVDKNNKFSKKSLKKGRNKKCANCKRDGIAICTLLNFNRSKLELKLPAFLPLLFLRQHQQPFLLPLPEQFLLRQRLPACFLLLHVQGQPQLSLSVLLPQL